MRWRTWGMMEVRKEKLSERFLSCDLLFIKYDVIYP